MNHIHWRYFTWCTMAALSLHTMAPTLLWASTKAYLLPDDPYAPVQIVELTKQKKPEVPIIKDPQLNVPRQTSRHESHKPKVVKPRVSPRQKSQIQLGQLKITGRLSTPRVKFKTQQPRIGIIDPRHRINTLKRLLDSIPDNDL